MKQDQFIKKHSSSWTTLKNTVELLDKKSMSKLESKELRRFLHLFRQTSHQLAYARTHFPNSDVVTYLNALVGRAHNHIYAVKKNSFSEVFYYIRYGFPKQAKKLRSYIIISFLIFLIGFGISMVLVNANPQSASYFLPQAMIDNIDWNMDTSNQWDYPLMSSYIMVNNISVSLRAFAFGITLGLGTIYILFFNGALLGALTGLVYHFGAPLNYWSLILPHGIIELTAIFISAGAGLIIARSILIPNEYSRKHSIIKASKDAVSLMLGVAFLLVIAGIIEGFFTPLDISPLSKLIFAALTLIGLIIYFAIPYFKSDV
ncbi:stage II sporulation protein M [Brassicibacter mesophilus]|uniref:stage II sporulation protein M n=1 Tax=Brassicibacter mesophilus TaxID=745119 RepID=UPI003D246E68